MEMSESELQSALPAVFRGSINKELLDEINTNLKNVDLEDSYADQLIWFGSALSDTRYSLSNYVKAVKYVSLKAVGHTNVSAWSTTFPDRFNRLKKLGKTAKEIHNHVASYVRSGLVVKLLAQAMVPVHLVNQKAFQDAINVQVHLMNNAKSETVRTTAANSILANVKPPEAIEIDIEVTNTDTGASAIDLLKTVSVDLAKQYSELLKNKAVTLETIAKSKITNEVNDEL
jgi:hypothetical protein